LKKTIIDNEQFTKHLIAKLPNWRYFFEILAKLGLIGKADIDHHHLAQWRIHPVGDGVFADNFDLKFPKRGVFFQKVTGLIRLALQAFEEFEYNRLCRPDPGTTPCRRSACTKTS
jgi:hypothetical protein